MGLEPSQVNPARHHPDAFGISPIVPNHLGAVEGCGGYDGIYLVQQAAFEGNAPPTLGLVVTPGDAVLHRTERVEHMHHRHAPTLAQVQGRFARKPVVTVNDIVGQILAIGKTAHPANELGQVGEHPILIVRCGGAGMQINYAHPIGQPFNRRCATFLTAGKNIHGDATGTQFAGQFAHIDIHPTSFFPAQFRQRTAMDAQHCDTHRSLLRV